MSEAAPKTKHKSSALVTPAWLHRHRSDPNVRVIEVAGLGQEQKQAYRIGHVPGAVCWDWKEIKDRPHPKTDVFGSSLMLQAKVREW